MKPQWHEEMYKLGVPSMGQKMYRQDWDIINSYLKNSLSMLDAAVEVIRTSAVIQGTDIQHEFIEKYDKGEI